PWSVSASRCSRVPHSRLAKSRIASTNAFCSSVRVTVMCGVLLRLRGGGGSEELRFLPSKLCLRGLAVLPLAGDPVPVGARGELAEHREHLHLESPPEQVLGVHVLMAHR